MLWDLRLMLCMDHSSCPHNKPTARVHLSSEHIPVCLLQSPGTELEPPTEFDLDSVLSEGCALLTPSSLRSLQPHCTFSMTANFRNSNHTLGSFCPLLCLMLHVRVVRSLQVGKQCWGGGKLCSLPFMSENLEARDQQWTESQKERQSVHTYIGDSRMRHTWFNQK